MAKEEFTSNDLLFRSGTVEDILQVVLKNRNAKVYTKDGNLTRSGRKALDHLHQILIMLAKTLEYTDYTDHKSLLSLAHADDILDHFEHIILRGM